VTWAFGYFMWFIVGLVLAAVTGLIRDLRSIAQHRLVVPHADLHFPFLGVVARRLSAGLVLFGLVGFVLSAQRGIDRRAALVSASVAGVLGILVASLMLRRPCRPEVVSQRATVVKEIQPGGYGQVRLERGGVSVLLAAQSADPRSIPAGAEVEVVECTRSVITVRLSPTR